jgi:hypothetical protein
MKPTIEQKANRFGGTDESKQVGHEAKQSDIAEEKKRSCDEIQCKCYR